MKYSFTPFAINKLTIKNRIVSVGHSPMYARDGLPCDTHLYYHAERAKGGVGLIIMEICNVHPTSFDMMNMIKGWTETCIPGYRAIAEEVHKYGCKIFSQIGHTGRQSDSQPSEMPLFAPSPIPCPVLRETPHEMSKEEIKEIIEAYAKTAGFIKEAGFDGVEIHSAHGGYLIAEFLSPHSNARSDEYGGSLENRVRFLTEVIGAVRDRVGKDFVVGVRISGDEFVEGGNSLDDIVEIIKMIEKTGRIDYIGQSMGTYASLPTVVPDMYFPPGSFSYLSQKIRENTNLPVIAAGRINDPVLAEKILANGQADLVGMARALIADAEFPIKAQEGRLDEIRPCVGCLQGCANRISRQLPMRCVHNPAVGKEKTLGINTLRTTKNRKRVMIVGGGPAGLKAAEIAAKRGHKVTVFEAKAQVGGQINLVCKVPVREEFGGIIRYLDLQIKKLGVDLHLEQKMDAEKIKEESPDALVISTGSSPKEWKVAEFCGMNVLNIWEALEHPEKISGRVLVVDDTKCDWETCGIVEYLLDRGKEVEVITTSLFIGSGLVLNSLLTFYRNALRKGAVFSPMERIVEISNGIITAVNNFSEKDRQIRGIDTIIYNIGRQANDNLFKCVKGDIPEIYCIGDAYAPRWVDSAIREGELVGRQL